MRLKWSVLFAGIAVLCSCKLSSDRVARDGEETTTIESRDVPFRGRVSIGVIRDAVVSIYRYSEASTKVCSDRLGVATTDNLGYFDVELDRKFLGQPILVEVSAYDPYLDHSSLECVTHTNNSPSMSCNVPGGCGVYQFGDLMPLDRDFRLSLAVASLHEGITYSVTLLTHLAESLTRFELDQLSTLSAETIEAPLMREQLIISSANSRVGSRFGIFGDVTSLQTVDVLSENEVLGANENELLYSALGIGMLSAVYNRNEDRLVSDGIGFFVSQYVVLGLGSQPDDNPDSPILSFVEILQGVEDALVYIESVSPSQDFSTLLSEVATAKGLAISDIYGVPEQGEASRSAILTPFEKAKSLIQDISQVTASVDLPRLVSLASVSSLVDPKTAAAIEQFGLDVSTNQILGGNQAGLIVSAASRLLTTILSAMELELTGQPIPASIDGIGFNYNVTRPPNTFATFDHTFVFSEPFSLCDESVDGCIVTPDLAITLRVYGLVGNQVESNLIAEDLQIWLTGNLTVDETRIRLEEASQSLQFDRPVLVDNPGENVEISLKSDEVTISLPYQMEFTEDGEVFSTNAQISLSSGPIDVDLQFGKNETNSLAGGVLVDDYSHIIVRQLESLRGSFNMGIENSDRDKNFVIALGLNQTKTYIGQPIRYSDVMSYDCPTFNSVNFDACEVVTEDSGFKDESETNFLSLAASIGFKANLKGLATPVLLEISGAREGPDANRIDRMKLRYPGQAISLAGTFTTRNRFAYMTSLDAVSLDGTKIDFRLREGSSERSGVIASSVDEEIAKIVDMGDWLNVEFNNGVFQSLCANC